MASLRGDRARLIALIKRLDRETRKAFMAAIRAARDAVDVDALMDALEAGDVYRAVELLTVRQGALFPFAQALEAAYVAGGLSVAQGIPARAGILGFDGRSVRAEQWARDHVGGMIREIIDEQREMVRGVVERQIARGKNPRAIIAELVGRFDPELQRRTGGIIGLTQYQEGIAARARAELETLDPAYLNRKLRDRRFDGAVKRAIAEGKRLSSSEVDKIVGRYRDGLLRNRAEAIARTESLNALRAGRREGIAQAIEQGIIATDRIKRVWDATLDKRTRPDHAAQDGQAVEGMDAPHVLRDGSRMMYPGDASLGAQASQTVQCRCFERFEVDWLRA